MMRYHSELYEVIGGRAARDGQRAGDVSGGMMMLGEAAAPTLPLRGSLPPPLEAGKGSRSCILQADVIGLLSE